MSNFLNTYFGPLPREYCLYFYILSIIFGFLFAASVLSITYFAIMHYNKVNLMFVVNSILAVFNTFLAYLANRLLYTMCVKSI
jgi:hypothetical protein